MAHVNPEFALSKQDVKSLWPDTLDEYPVNKLPNVFFVDDFVTGLTVAGPCKTEEHAYEVLSCLLWQHPDGLAVRHYKPSPEQFEELCRQFRELRHWAQGFGGPGRSWQAADDSRQTLLGLINHEPEMEKVNPQRKRELRKR